MARLLLLLQLLNLLVGCVCICILALAAHSTILKDHNEPPSTLNVKGTGVGMLFWAGCGGIVDMLLFLGLLIFAPPVSHALLSNGPFENPQQLIMGF